ncbi:MAG: hypothetical protein K8R48_01960 [Alphaproteobacteria bacterium]|nr:hypothetical protein [Alphaproteobacteria bacterium]
MKNNTKLAIAFTLAAALMSSTAMAGTAAGTSSADRLWEADPAKMLYSDKPAEDTVILWPLDEGMDSSVVKDGGRLLTEDQVRDFYPHFPLDLLEEPRLPHERESDAGEALVRFVMKQDDAAFAFDEKRTRPPQVAEWIAPERMAALRFAKFDDAIDRVVRPDFIDAVPQAAGDDLTRNRRVAIIVMAALAAREAGANVTGNDARVGDNTFFNPTGRELGAAPATMLFSDELLKEIRILEKTGGEASIGQLKTLYEELEEALEIEKKINTADIISRALIDQMESRGLDTKALMKIPVVAHILAEIPENQYPDILKLSEEYAGYLSKVKPDDTAGMKEILDKFAYKLTGTLKLDDEEYSEMKGLTSDLISLGGLTAVGSEEELAEFNMKLVAKDFFDAKFVAALKAKDINTAALFKDVYIAHFLAEIDKAKRPDIVKLSAEFAGDLADSKIKTGEVLNKFLSQVTKSIDITSPEEEKEIEMLLGKVTEIVGKAIPAPPEDKKFLEVSSIP